VAVSTTNTLLKLERSGNPDKIGNHLGNNRVTIKDSLGYAAVQQEDHYYPFGMTLGGQSWQNTLQNTKNDYLYNGKEFQNELGLDWYDYGARFYDAALGRFSTQDAYAEKYHFMSPYQYGANNPIKYIDVNGDSTAYFTASGSYLFTINDKNENGITVISSRKLLNFWAKFADLANNGKLMESTDQLRSFGDTYMAEDMWSYNDDNNNVPDKNFKALTEEFGTCLYQNKKGEIRTGKENYEGEWDGVWRLDNFNIGGSGPKNSDEVYVSAAHLHTNVGKFTPKGGGLPSPSDPDDYKSAPGPDDHYWNAVISNKEIQLYKTVRVNNISNGTYTNFHRTIIVQRYPFKGIKQ
jgi:RHS repeat-associated protein